MSGFEIAGIVLASFSILADAVKDSQGLYQKTKRWWSFDIAFEDFLLRLDTERVAFLQNLDNLLTSVDITDAEKQSLMRDPHCSSWHDPHVQAELRRRITAQYYGWYISVLGDIREAILEINNCLPISKAYQVEAKSFENVMFKAKTSLFSRKDRLLQRIQNRNDDLSKFLLRESLRSKTSPQNNILSGSGNERIRSRPFLKLQKSSRELYGSLQGIWPCQCSSGHSCGVASTWDTSGQTPRHGALALLYRQPEDNSCFELRVEEIGPDCDASSETSTKATFIQDLPDLRQNIANQNRAKKLKGKGILRKLGQSSLSAFLNPARSKSDGSSTTTVSTSNSTMTVVTPALTPSSSAKGVKFAKSLVPSSPDWDPKVPILTDICASLAAPLKLSSCLGFLQTSSQTRLLLHITSSITGNMIRPQSLTSFIDSNPHRSKRMHLALNIILTTLSVDPSLWLPSSSFNKSHIQVVASSNDTTPFFYHPAAFSKFHSATATTITSPTATTRDISLSLGIILLELLFGQSLESRPERSEFMGPDGKPNKYTDLCTAMEWQRAVEMEVGDGMGEAIRRCVWNDFGAAAADANASSTIETGENGGQGGSSLFVAGVLEGVVRPVGTFLSRWDQGTAMAKG